MVKENAGAVPVVVNTGVGARRPSPSSLQHADAAIVGTWLKHDGVFENQADPDRVHRLMDEVRALRGQLAR